MTTKILHGDCRVILATLPTESAQCCVCSPPYFGLRDYGVDGQIGLEPSPQAYVDQLVAVFREVRRVLRTDGTLWLNLGDSYATQGGRGEARMAELGKPSVGAKTVAAARGMASGTKIPPGLKPKDLMLIPARVALALQADGWWIRSEIIWSKAAPMPESVRDRPTCAHEKVFLLTKAANYFYDADAVAEPAIETGRAAAGRDGINRRDDTRGRKAYCGATSIRNLRNVWHLNPEPFPGAHFATMPPTLAERCIKAGTSEKGQCPCCGAPWVRVVTELADDTTAYRSDYASAHALGSGRRDSASRRVKGKAGGAALPTRATVTTGWSPSCACPAHEPVPQTVLDCFAGAGTTLLVADRLQRHGIGIELNPKDVAMAERRIRDDAPLLTELAACA